jgi:competence protein ComEA
MNTPISAKYDSLVSRTFIHKIPREVMLLGLALSVIILGIGLLVSTLEDQNEQVPASDSGIAWERPSPNLPGLLSEQNTIMVDVSGAVQKPGMYEVSASARLSEAVSLADGLTEQADKEYYYRNYNLAKKLVDQEKIYIPHRYEIQTGLFTENSRILRYEAANTHITPHTIESRPNVSTSSLISINTATTSELETLPGIGPVTAAKIIDNRPYSAIKELRDANVVGPSVYENIYEMISL